MAKSNREYKHKSIGTSDFCVVSNITRTRTGMGKATARKTVEYEDGVIIVTVSAASAGYYSANLWMDGIILKNFPFKFDIVDVHVNMRTAKATTNIKIMKNLVSFKLASQASQLICQAISIGQTANAITRATVMNNAVGTIDVTDKIYINVVSGASNTAWGFRAYLRVVPART
jgi:hypothetical protein